MDLGHNGPGTACVIYFSSSISTVAVQFWNAVRRLSWFRKKRPDDFCAIGVLVNCSINRSGQLPYGGKKSDMCLCGRRPFAVQKDRSPVFLNWKVYARHSWRNCRPTAPGRWLKSLNRRSWKKLSGARFMYDLGISQAEIVCQAAWTAQADMSLSFMHVNETPTSSHSSFTVYNRVIKFEHLKP